MKLYTRDQMIEAMRFVFMHDTDETPVEFIDTLTPIELPSDDEIDEESFIVNPPKIQNDYGKDDDDNIQYRDEWIGGAKWVIEQIKQQDNGK